MTDEELRAYAIAGVTARLAAIDEERAHLKDLLARLGDADDARTSPRSAGDSPRAEAVPSVRRLTRRATRPDATRPDAPAPHAPAPEASLVEPVREPEVARQLPRRGRLPRPLAPDVAALPPMPRLVKGNGQ